MLSLIIAAQLTLSGPAEVVDGDTLRFPDLPVTVRLWGIDAPETNAPGGASATDALAELIADAIVTCRSRGQDRYQRIVAQCRVGDRDIAGALIRRGAAIEWCKYSKGYYGTAQSDCVK